MSIRNNHVERTNTVVVRKYVVYSCVYTLEYTQFTVSNNFKITLSKYPSKYFLTYFESIKVPPGYMKMFNKTSTGRPD